MPKNPCAHPGILHTYHANLTALEHTPHHASTDASSTNGNKVNVDIGAEEVTNYILFLGGLGDGLCHPSYPSKLATFLTKSVGLELQTNVSSTDHGNGSSSSEIKPPANSKWRVVEVLLSSSYSGWTTSTLSRDADELAHAVAYFRRSQQEQLRHSSSTQQAHDENTQSLLQTPPATNNNISTAETSHTGKIILLGHSTGCQIAMEYVCRPRTPSSSSPPSPSSQAFRPKPKGIILQAGVSDREAMIAELSPDDLATSISTAHSYIDSGRGTDHLPYSVHKGVMGAAPSAERWSSLVEAKGCGDDYFSSDLDDGMLDGSFGVVGRRGVRVCVLFSGDDEFVPGWVGKEALVERWKSAVGRGVEAAGKLTEMVEGDKESMWDESSGVVPGASHNLEGDEEEVVRDVCERVRGFVGRC